MNYTKAQIRGAILRAASSIEDDASKWNFGNCYTGKCGTPMCAAGWIGFHLGFPVSTPVHIVGQAIGLEDYCAFSEQMKGIDRNWFSKSVNAVRALRKYADKYFPEAVVIADPSHLPCEPQFLTQLSSWMRKERVS